MTRIGDIQRHIQPNGNDSIVSNPFNQPKNTRVISTSYFVDIYTHNSMVPIERSLDIFRQEAEANGAILHFYPTDEYNALNLAQDFYNHIGGNFAADSDRLSRLVRPAQFVYLLIYQRDYYQEH